MYGRASPMTESVVTSTMSGTPEAGSGAGNLLQPPAAEKRVGKTNRRRPRASRKTPTTVFNTDTTNFRAMVQQYTGGPSNASLQAAYPLLAEGLGGGSSTQGPTTLNFGSAAGTTAQQLHHQPNVFPATMGIQQQYQQYALSLQSQQQPFRPPGGTGGDLYFSSRFGSRNPLSDVSDGFLIDRVPSSQMMPRPAASTGSTTTDQVFLF